MEMNNTLKYNLLCVVLVFNSIYFMLSPHDRLGESHRFMRSECGTVLQRLSRKSWGPSHGGREQERLVGLGRLKKQAKNRGKRVKLAFVAGVIVRKHQLPLKLMPLDFARPLVQTKESSHPSELLLQAGIFLVFMRVCKITNRSLAGQEGISGEHGAPVVQKTKPGVMELSTLTFHK